MRLLVDNEGAGNSHVRGCVLPSSRPELFHRPSQSVSSTNTPQPGRVACPDAFQSWIQVCIDRTRDLPALLIGSDHSFWLKNSANSARHFVKFHDSPWQITANSSVDRQQKEGIAAMLAKLLSRSTKMQEARDEEYSSNMWPS